VNKFIIEFLSKLIEMGAAMRSVISETLISTSANVYTALANSMLFLFFKALILLLFSLSLLSLPTFFLQTLILKTYL